MRQNRQFLSSITAVDIHGRIGLCVPQLLRVFERRSIVGTLFIHLRNNVVARAVENAPQGQNLVCGEALTNVCDDWDTTADAGFKCDRASKCSSAVEQFFSVLCQKRLVGRDDVFSRFEYLEHDGTRRLEATNQKCDHFYFGVVQHEP